MVAMPRANDFINAHSDVAKWAEGLTFGLCLSPLSCLCQLQGGARVMNFRL